MDKVELPLLQPQKLVLRLVGDTNFRPVEQEISPFIKVISSKLNQWGLLKHLKTGV